MAKEVVAILHNHPLPTGSPGWQASRDVLIQVKAVATALHSLGRRAVPMAVGTDPAAWLAALKSSHATLVVNLCESINDDPTLIGHPAAVLELQGLPFTGSSAFALMLSTDKAASKLLMQGAGIPTPPGFLYDGTINLDAAHVRYPLIAKPRFEDASIGIDQGSIFQNRAELLVGARRLFDRHGPLLIEAYIAGREINVAVLGAPALEVLAIAEIDFSAFPETLYPIVGYQAKWDDSSFEYQHTPRVFPNDLPPPVVAALHQEVRRCCQVFQLRDYGRVDIRLDESMAIHVLEVNANPCLSPDAGFCAAARHAGLTFVDLLDRLLTMAEARR